MTEYETGRIKDFMNDTITSELIYQSLMQSFLKKRQDEDVTMKAARFVAIELLLETWQELDKVREKEKEKQSTKSVSGQIGL